MFVDRVRPLNKLHHQIIIIIVIIVIIIVKINQIIVRVKLSGKIRINKYTSSIKSFTSYNALVIFYRGMRYFDVFGSLIHKSST